MRSKPAPTTERSLAYLALAIVGIGLTVTGLRPESWRFFNWQSAVLFKQATGYLLLALFAFLACYGWWRRQGAPFATKLRPAALHHWAGVAAAAGLLAHMGNRPAGMLLALLGLAALATISGAVRTHLGPKASAAVSKTLLLTHMVSATLAFGLSLAHVYFVYIYTA
jgi:cytochrome b